MGEWTDAVLRVVGELPHSAGGLMYMVLLAALVFLVFLAAHAHGEKPEAAVKHHGDSEVHTD